MNIYIYTRGRVSKSNFNMAVKSQNYNTSPWGGNSLLITNYPKSRTTWNLQWDYNITTCSVLMHCYNMICDNKENDESAFWVPSTSCISSRPRMIIMCFSKEHSVARNSIRMMRWKRWYTYVVVNQKSFFLTESINGIKGINEELTYLHWIW